MEPRFGYFCVAPFPSVGNGGGRKKNFRRQRKCLKSSRCMQQAGKNNCQRPNLGSFLRRRFRPFLPSFFPVWETAISLSFPFPPLLFLTAGNFATGSAPPLTPSPPLQLICAVEHIRSCRIWEPNWSFFFCRSCSCKGHFKWQSRVRSGRNWGHTN